MRDTTRAARIPIMSTSLLLWGVLFSGVGLGYFRYGRKQKAIVPTLCGVTMMVMPYAVSTVPLLITLGVALAVLPYFVRI